MIGPGKIAVVGIGNILLGDEGVGVHVLNELRDRYCFPDGVELIDGGTMGLDLLPFIEGRQRVIFIDAVDFGAEAGAVGELRGGEIPERLSSKLSVHQIALPEMLSAGRLLGTLPEEICLVGIQPKSIDPGFGLSPEIEAKVDELMARVVRKLSEWGIEVRSKVHEGS